MQNAGTKHANKTTQTAGRKRESKATVTVLGIDPGTRRMGFGWIEFLRDQPEKIVARGFGVIEPARELGLEARLAGILTELEIIFAERRPAKLVIENIFVSKSVTSALALGYSRGVVLAVAGRYQTEVLPVAAKSAKKSVTGRGNAEKEDVCILLGRLLNLGDELKKLPLDASDGLALAYQGWRQHVAAGLQARSIASPTRKMGAEL